jgi:type IV pilus assembly protein PilW
VQYYYKGAYSYPPAGGPGGALPPLNFVPVVITDSIGAPDAITVLFGSDLDRMVPSKLTDSMPQASAEYKVDGTAGFGQSDMVIVTEGGKCVLTQITEVQKAASHLQHNPNVGVPWNPTGGASLLPKFNAGATLFNLGNPTWRMYSIGSNRLQAAEVLTTLVPGGAPTALVDDIVDLQAEYGKDTDADGAVDAWNATPPTSAAEWLQVLAVRLGVLVRSQNFEKPSVAGDPCEATTATPTWTGSANANSVFTVPGGLPSCYKHRVFETVVPIRNMIWRPA